MSSKESNPSLPVPEDELKKARLGGLRVGLFDDKDTILNSVAKSMGVKRDSANIAEKSEQEKKDILLVELATYLADIELGPEAKEGDKNTKRRDKIYEGYTESCLKFIESVNKRFPRFSAIQAFVIDKGILSLFVIIPPRQDTHILPINLHGLFKKGKGAEIVLDEKKLALELQGRAKEDLSKLRESLETESLFGGSIIVTYEQIDTVKKVVPTAIAVASGFDIAYRVKKLMFRDEAGKIQEVDQRIIRNMLKGIGDKTRINRMIFPIMRKLGRVYNPIQSAFTDMTTLGIDRATERVKLLKRTDIEKGRNMTDVEFESEKQRVIQEIARMPKNEVIARIGKIIKSLPSASIQGVIYGVFFADYQKHTYDIAQLYRGLAEAGVFEVGQAIGQRITPGVWKLPGGIMGGGLAIMGGHMAGGAMHLDKKVWRALPERMTSDGVKSFGVHAVTGGVVNDTADRIGRDIGIPGTRGGAVLYNPFGADGIMPNVDFAGTHITFGTDHRAYLQSRVGGTDIHWNKRMDEYVSWATEMTMRILQEYDNNRGYFASSNGIREELLRERLRYVFDSEDGKNTRNRQIIDDCIDYISTKLIKIKDLNSRKELLSIFLGNYGNILKIDKDSLEYDEKLLDRDKTTIDGQRNMYLTLLTPERRIFAEKLFARLEKGERLIDGKIITRKGDMIGQDVQVFMRDKIELGIYQSLIDDTSPVKQEWYEVLGYNTTINYQNLAFQLPDKRVSIGSKTVYLRSYFDIIYSEYLQGIKSGNLNRVSEVDKKYGIQTANKVNTGNNKMVSDIQFRAILLESLCSAYPDISKIISPPPTTGDAFVHLLNVTTEYREQKRFLQNQKDLGYASKWTY